MNKWISISITGVLVAGLAASLFLYFQESNNLKAAEAEIVDLEGDVLSLEENVSTLEENVTTLEIDLGVAEAEISMLESELEDKEAEISTLQSNLAEAEVEISTLQSDLEAAEAEIAALEIDLAAAEAEVLRLEEELTTAQGDITRLEEELATAQAEVASLTQTLAQAQEEKTLLEAQILEWENAYSNIRDEINERLGNGEDAMKFITPNNEAVTRLVTGITGGFSQDILEWWNDITRLYYWVVNNIDYNYDTRLPFLPLTLTGTLSWQKDYWRIPEETIADGMGDCEDMAVLLTSMIINYNEGRYDTWVIGIRNEDTAHVAVAIPLVGDKLAILDPAGNFYTGMVSGKPISEAINEWLQYWSNQMPNAYIHKAFNHKFYETFASTDEFIAWAEERYD